MKYFIDYQYMGKTDARPSDDGEVVGIEATDAGGTVVIPNVGDYIHIDNSYDKGERSNFSGKVRSRFFRYIRVPDEIHCLINIVVQETDDDFGKLVKE